MNTKKLLIFFLMLTMGGCQKRAGADKFEQVTKITTLLNETGDQLTVRVVLEKDFHAYGPKEQIGKPVRLAIQPDNGWAAVGAPVIPMGKHKKLVGLGDSYVIEGSFSVEQKVKPGTGPGKALLYLQICTQTLCDRPRTHELVLESPAAR